MRSAYWIFAALDRWVPLARAARLISRVRRVVTDDPLFVVRTVDRRDAVLWPPSADDVDESQHPTARFRLMPTKTYWTWILLGVAVTAAPVTTSLTGATVALVLALIWVWYLAWRLSRFARQRARMTGTRDYFKGSPPDHRRWMTMRWIPAAVVCLIATSFNWWTAQQGDAPTSLWESLRWALNLAASGGSDHMARVAAARGLNNPPHFGFELMALTALGPIAIYAMALNRRGQMAAVPSIDAWYHDLPSTVKPLVDRAASRRNRYPSSSWRSVTDISQELSSAAVASAFFGEYTTAAVWKRSTMYGIYCYAPIIVPLIALFAAPLVAQHAGHYLGIGSPSKLSLGLCVVVWAAWSICFFLAVGRREIVTPAFAPRVGGRPLLADIFHHPNLAMRMSAARQFVSTPSLGVFSAIALSVMPIYFDYVGLFDEVKVCRTDAAREVCETVSSVSGPAADSAAPQGVSASADSGIPEQPKP